MIINIAAILLIILGDQLSKLWVVAYLKPVGSMSVIPRVFHLTYAQNEGAAFSILSGQQAFLVIVTTAALVIALIALIKYYKTSNLLRCAIVFIIGGAIGNMIDRLRLGYVVDMFDVRAIQFAIFNIADCFITVGAILAAIYVFQNMYKEVKGAKKHAKE